PSPATLRSRVLSLGAFRPNSLVNDDHPAWLINALDEWIQQRPGIVTRQRAVADTSVVDMALSAGKQAIERAGIKASDLRAIIVSTVTFPYPTGSAAALIAGKLDITVPAYDISATRAG